MKLLGQFSRYMNHVTKNVGGIYETFKSVEQPGEVYEPTPKIIQEQSVVFLQKQLFETPYWLLDKNILDKISPPSTSELVSNTQGSVLSSLLSTSRLFRMEVMSDRYGKATVYGPQDLITDLENGLWKELGTAKARSVPAKFTKTIRRHHDFWMNPSQPHCRRILGINYNFRCDITRHSVHSGHLTALRNRILSAAGQSTDLLSKYHLQDLAKGSDRH
jgi:hypothetical protein